MRMDNFDPNKKHKPEIAWGTFIPGRRPQWKTHSDRGKAMNAISYMERPAVLYHYEGNEWVEVYRKEIRLNQQPGPCEICGEPFTKQRWGYSGGTARWVEDPTLRQIFVHYGCKKAPLPNIEV